VKLGRRDAGAPAEPPDLTELATTLGKGYLDQTLYLQALLKIS